MASVPLALAEIRRPLAGFREFFGSAASIPDPAARCAIMRASPPIRPALGGSCAVEAAPPEQREPGGHPALLRGSVQAASAPRRNTRHRGSILHPLGFSSSTWRRNPVCFQGAIIPALLGARERASFVILVLHNRRSPERRRSGNGCAHHGYALGRELAGELRHSGATRGLAVAPWDVIQPRPVSQDAPPAAAGVSPE